MREVPHHFAGILNLEDYYSAAMFEEEVLALLPQLWKSSDYAVLCGGSMMYVDAVTKGIDVMPTVSEQVRRRAYDIYHSGGIEAARSELLRLDPDYYSIVDLNNYKRIVHAIEICLEAGVPYSTLRTGVSRERPFRILKFAIDRTREDLFGRINRRAVQMLADGLEAEARAVYPKRHLNSLNTVGFKEMFAYFDGVFTLPEAVEKIARNTRVYAKKQLTWMKKDTSLMLLDPEEDMERRILSML